MDMDFKKMVEFDYPIGDEWNKISRFQLRNPMTSYDTSTSLTTKRHMNESKLRNW
jgi:hypothetical protein